MMVMRDIPSETLRVLRKEAGFVCANPACSSPYLEFHHFDPPFALHPHHNPDGMIALCTGCHRRADAGAFSHDELRQWKSSCRKPTSVTGHFDFKSEQVLLSAGGGVFVGAETLLTLNGSRIAWLSNEEGKMLLNLEIQDPDGREIVMRDNCWVAPTDFFEIESPPHAHALKIRRKLGQIVASVHFRRLHTAELRVLLRKRHDKMATQAARMDEKLAAESDQRRRKMVEDGLLPDFRPSPRISSAPTEAERDERTDEELRLIETKFSNDDFVLCTLGGDFGGSPDVLVGPVRGDVGRMSLDAAAA